MLWGVFILLVHGIQHWMAISTLGFQPSEVKYYDSMWKIKKLHNEVQEEKILK